MSLFTGTNVSLSVWKQIIWTKREQVKLADLKIIKEYFTYILVIEVITLRDSDEKGFVSIFAHELVEFLLDEIHFKIININYSTVALVFIDNNCSTLSGSSQLNCSSLSRLHS
jgi:hypothetical protein